MKIKKVLLASCCLLASLNMLGSITLSDLNITFGPPNHMIVTMRNTAIACMANNT